MFPHSTMLKSSSLLCHPLTITDPLFHRPIQSIPLLSHSRFKSNIISMESTAMFDIQEPLTKMQKIDTYHQIGKNGHKETPTVPLLLVKKLSDKAILPSRGSALAAGYDLSSAVACFVPARGKALVQTDLSIAIPQETYARIAPRSGLAWKHSIDVGAGVIDADYRGPVGVILFNHSDQDFEIKAGDRIAQLILERIVTPNVEEADDLDATCRGAGGFGSTGV